jgi:hypothetical protein
MIIKTKKEISSIPMKKDLEKEFETAKNFIESGIDKDDEMIGIFFTRRYEIKDRENLKDIATKYGAMVEPADEEWKEHYILLRDVSLKKLKKRVFGMLKEIGILVNENEDENKMAKNKDEKRER